MEHAWQGSLRWARCHCNGLFPLRRLILDMLRQGGRPMDRPAARTPTQRTAWITLQSKPHLRTCQLLRWLRPKLIQPRWTLRTLTPPLLAQKFHVTRPPPPENERDMEVEGQIASGVNCNQLKIFTQELPTSICFAVEDSDSSKGKARAVEREDRTLWRLSLPGSRSFPCSF